MGKGTRISTLMSRIGWLNIREMQMQHSCMMFWKMLHLGAPGHLRDRLNMDNDWILETNETRLRFTSRGYRWKTSKLWNELPGALRKEKSISRFKTLLKQWILDKRNKPPDPPDT